jgi:hypothetical protein
MRALLNSAFALLFALSSFIPQPSFASIPLPSSPSWTSSDNDYSTGGALADLNGDGWLDFLMSNGNDMAMDKNSVYMNNAGTLETVAFWRSSDNGYFGHCYAGDVNNDGLPDLAVAYLGSRNSGDHLARIYLNSGGTLGTSPAWKAADRHSSFDCCLGDVDLDGDLDLAICAGDAYAPIEYDRARIYRNNGGAFDTLPFWSAKDTNPGDAVRFCDIDNDGDLDLFVGQVIPGSGHGKVTICRNNGGVLDTVPSWTAQQGVGWVLRLAFADYDNDGFLDLAVASNDQQGEPNSIKVFHNNSGTLDTVASFTMLRAKTYSSCVAWADVNGDEYPDLAAGGWWEPAVVFENHAGVLDTTPTWSWSPTPPDSLICEAVVWGDLTNGHLSSVTESYDGDGQRKLFNLHRRPLQFLDSVCVGGVRVPDAGFCSDPLLSWVSFASAPPSGTANVVCFYRYSAAPDLAVTNWSATWGSHVFLNTTPAGIAAHRDELATSRLTAWPNPFRTAVRLLAAAHGSSDVRIVDAAGREVRVLRAPRSPLSTPYSLSWDGCDETGQPVEPGVYFAALGSAEPTLKLVRISQN